MRFKFKVSVVGALMALSANPAYSQSAEADLNMQSNVGNPDTLHCTVAVWTPTKFKYSLQGVGHVLGGLLGALAEDAANKDKLENRKNELEKALDPEVVFNIFQSSNIKSILDRENIRFIAMRNDLDPKYAVKLGTRSTEDNSECYMELFVTRVRAEKTAIYGTFFDTSFAMKDFRSKNVPHLYKNSIRRKIKNFPPNSEDEVEISYQGVRQIFSEQLEFFIENYRKK